jgi:hypothetical protein
VPSRENHSLEQPTLVDWTSSTAWKAAARAAAAFVARLRRRRAAIHVSDVSEEWLTSHAADTPKHDEQND